MVSDPHRNGVAGEMFQAGASASVPAWLVTRDDMAVVSDENGRELARERFSDLEISVRVGAIARRIAFSDHRVFETGDNDGVDELLRKAGHDRSGWIHRAEAFHPRLAAFIAAAAVFVFAIYRWGLPALVEVAVAITPPVIPQAISATTMASLDRAMFSETTLDTDTRKSLAAGFARLASKSHGGATGYTLNFRRGGVLGPNALALPDGTIVITDELVKLADGDEEMLLGVLSHEIGHVDHEHSLRQIYRAAGIAGMIMIIGGDVGSGIEDILVEGGGLLALSFSRSAEEQADRHSVELMARSGLDPEAIARFFKIIEQKLGDIGETSILSTHPSSPERRQAVLDYARSLEDSREPAEK